MRALGGLLVIFANGCSFIFMHGAPTDHQKLADFDCVSSSAAPAADIAGAALSVVYAVGTAATFDRSEDDDGFLVFPIAFGALAALEIASAIHGFGSASSCAHAKQQLATRRIEQDKANALKLQQLQAQLQAAQAGCAKDTDCKGERLCVTGRCVEARASPATASPPPASVPPAAAPSVP